MYARNLEVEKGYGKITKTSVLSYKIICKMRNKVNNSIQRFFISYVRCMGKKKERQKRK